MKAIHIFLVIAGLILVTTTGVLLGALLVRFVRPQTAPTQQVTTNTNDLVIISGSIQYNGIRPLPGNENLGKVTLYQRVLGETEFTQIPITVPLVSAATWSWSGAENGKTYEIQAAVEFAGREIAKSSTIIVTAPAGGEQLTFNVSADQVPQDLLVMSDGSYNAESAPFLPTPKLTPASSFPQASASPIPSPSPTNIVSLSGRVNLSGYVPPNARFVLKVAPEGTEAFQVVTSDIEVKDSAVWIWSGAQVGQRYKVMLELLDKDIVIGRSEQVVMVAPAANQYLQVASTAKIAGQASGERAAIVGKIDLNGPVANNSSILILQRKPGQTAYSPVARIPAADGQTWSFDSALSGTQYEMTAALQVNEQNTSSANAVSLTAPASNIVFRINTNVSLDAPGKPRLLTCGTKKANGKWPAEVVFDQIQNANSYWLQIGSTAGNNNIYNERRVRSKSNEEKVTLELESNKEYFARYAQAQCIDCRSDQDYSGFSESARIICTE
jgi:hypothetical protein